MGGRGHGGSFGRCGLRGVFVRAAYPCAHLLARARQVVLWASALGGAVLVLAADIAVRLVLPDREPETGGVLTAIVGAPSVPALGVSRHGGRRYDLVLPCPILPGGPWPL